MKFELYLDFLKINETKCISPYKISATMFQILLHLELHWRISQNKLMMATSMKKFSVGFLVMLLVTLTVSSSFTNAGEEYKVQDENRDFLVGIPLYRFKDKPNVLIPAFEIDSVSHNKKADSPWNYAIAWCLCSSSNV